MSKRLVQDLHAGISRRDWSAVETAANRLRDEVDQTVEILAGAGVGSLPNDYPLSQLAAEALSETNKQPAGASDNRHEFVPNPKYPWFCAHCGYAPHEPLKHFQPEASA